MRNTIGLMSTVACLAVLIAAPAQAQQAGDTASGTQSGTAEDQDEGANIIVSGIRDSLRKAAQVKRDADQVIDIGFPVFCSHTTPADIVERWTPDERAFGEPVTIGPVTLRTGDYVIGDRDGVVLIPAEIAEMA
ncbi:MAG: hypothetical protein HC870_00715, partial [Rhizobiales bacterium]|nr:hypothetical protein [Hyphomicrobiales bacterium]